MTEALSYLQQAQQIVAVNDTADALIADLMHLLEAHDPLSASHAFGVAIQADAIAMGMELESTQRQKVWRAALMHDIGKLAVPPEILRSPNGLTPEARVMIVQHPDVGADLMQSSPALADLAPAVRHHHERWDGQGYPAQLASEAIPLEARIVGLCDAVHSMSMNRPYQQARTPDQIIAEVVRCAGRQFDPALVEVLSLTRGVTVFVPAATRSSAVRLTPWPV